MLPVRSAGSPSDAGLPAAYSIAARINTLHTAHVLTSRYYLLDSKSGIIGAEFLDPRRAPSTAPVCF
jgi:hypothetical protein